MNININKGIWDKDWYSKYIQLQLQNHFPDGYSHKDELLIVIPKAIEKQFQSLKFVRINSHQVFSHLHSDLYAQFLYFVSNIAWREGFLDLAQKTFYLNKSLHALNCSYSTQLPDVFLFFHIVGTVLGKADYSDYLVVNQNVTVGTNKNITPRIGKGVMLRPNVSVIGNSDIGNFTSLSINTTIFDESVPQKSIVIGSSPNLIIKTAKRFLIEDVFYI